jgi:hypothetical protein
MDFAKAIAIIIRGRVAYPLAADNVLRVVLYK